VYIIDLVRDSSPTKRLALTLATELRSAQVSCARHYSGGLIAIEGKKNHKKAIRTLTQRIAEHESKISLEYEKENPDEGLIRHWQTEIHAFEKGIQQAHKRLGD